MANVSYHTKHQNTHTFKTPYVQDAIRSKHIAHSRSKAAHTSSRRVPYSSMAYQPTTQTPEGVFLSTAQRLLSEISTRAAIWTPPQIGSDNIPLEIVMGYNTWNMHYYLSARINIAGTMFPLFGASKRQHIQDSVSHEDFGAFSVLANTLLRKIWRYYRIENHRLEIVY
jgi:hypothetical protein